MIGSARGRGRRRRWIAAAAGALLVISAAALGFVLKDQSTTFSARAPGERPELLLLTSLPIVFPEQFTLEGSKSPALAALQTRYTVVPVSTADTRSLDGRRLLLMAQPQAQPAEVLVELDRWVRNGGHVLLLADPALARPSERPLGDIFRPPTAFADTGLLAHWGLRLDSPDEPGARSLEVDGREIRTLSPGRFVATGGNCSLLSGGFVARCRVGEGSVSAVADADFLDLPDGERANQAGNLDLLLAELARLER
ncbi:MAG: hypothetical protein ACR2JJ_06040 [Sphingomicrobium sp.]